MSKFTDYVLLFIAISIMAFFAFIALSGPVLKAMTASAEVVVFTPIEEVTITLPYKAKLVVKKKDLTGTAISVKVIIYKTYPEVAKALLKHNGDSYPTLWGWQTDRNGVCEIHVVEPKYTRMGGVFSTWGHELGHCVYGTFHTR